MKKIILLVCLIHSFVIFSQVELMRDGSVTTCTGTFYDSGGVGADYANNESFTFTIWPNIPGGQAQLDFIAFNVQQNVDFMTIYNGPDTTYDVLATLTGSINPVVVTASLASIIGGQPNPGGCLTIVFTSDNATTDSGWEATISCFEPCQDIQAIIDSTLPVADIDGIVRICQGDQVTFNGSGIFLVDGTGATYDWDFGDGTTGTGTTTTKTFTDEGIYTVSLVITDTNPQGCTSTNISEQPVYVSSTPDFTGTQAAETIICLGEETTIEAVVTPVLVAASCANGGEQTALGDVQGVTFESSLDLNCFQGQTLTDVAQLESICLVIEHTYIGDLEIIVRSPSGQAVTLHNRGGNSLYLGNPITSDGTGSGEGWEYCFSMNATTFLQDGATVQSGTPNPGLTVVAGTYLPLGDFNNFLGSTIDGQWTLEIIDHEMADDGTIFSWSLNFDETLLSSNFTFTPTIFTEAWDADASITNTVGNTITVQPTTAGTQCYTYRVTDDFGCEYTQQVCIEVLPEIVPIVPTPIEECDDAVADGFTIFDLTLKDTEITSGNPDWIVSYFETNVDAQNDTNPVSPANAFTNTSNGQIVYVRVNDTTTGCFGFTTLTLNVLSNPASLTDALDLIFCDDTNPGDNQEVFDLAVNEAYIINGEIGVTATYYETASDAQANINAISNATTYTNLSSPQTIYVRVTNDTTGCFTVVDFDIIVNPLPLVTTVTDFIVCEVNFDGVNQFDLESKTLEVLNGQSQTDFMVTYHINQADADAGINPLVSPYTNIVNPEQIFVNITNTLTGCAISTVSFNIEEINNPTANNDLIPIEYTLCDNIGNNDGIAQFDLTTQDVYVLDGQDPNVYGVTYYETQADADLGINPLPILYENIQNPQVIYARVEDIITPNAICYATTNISLNVNLLPEFSLDDFYVLCVNNNGTEIVAPPLLDTGLSVLDYTFEWRLDGAVITGAIGSSYLITQAGDYSVTVTDNITSCQRTLNTTVNESSPPIVNATVTSLAFSDNNVIEVEVIGIGVYEYSLDGGPWQESNVFEDVSLGEHVITVRDLNGCGIGSDTVIVLDYPKYFTPNGDGFNDTWNIAGINTQPTARIFIFDRFGKLLKQLSSTGIGWNGTFNGANLPAADYWFTVQYLEPSDGTLKQFKAHFALKR
ncbi:MAG: T9SS type B sorting domain-containing protein [Chlorobi bacterium]|nr:T9SS type B sorting domain-containing protein [Chlorobiota bacterium]